MEMIYLGLVVFLFILAAFDLHVGVSNDAVNFLNSAIGSKTAKFKTLVIVAGLGVFCGCVMSNGMMDIARHGILNPSQFYFDEIMIVFVAVMVTDIVLLDVFNSFGMPTSTTVSMVFELMGAACAFAIFKMTQGSERILSDFMNTSKTLEIVISIFMSVALAFVMGYVVMYVSRLLFSFMFKKHLTWKIGIFGGLALTTIVYFMLFKGLKSMAFMTDATKDFVDQHALLFWGGCFVLFTALMQILHFLKINVFRIVVLCGTFALAMAFAGNDLVNFIGVPLAGFDSFQDFLTHPDADPSTFAMTSLMESAQTEWYFLTAAGIIMVWSLATSKKAHNVVKTEVGLATQGESDELFGSSKIARSIVRFSTNTANLINRHTPAPISKFIEKRFTPAPTGYNVQGIAFDQVRASVNLIASALLIALGTSLKLPLSTTYVTFMVAMGTSLADRAWSRESAVFRITGVLTVIGAWFITAGAAFTAAFLIALIMEFGGMPLTITIVLAAICSLFYSHRVFKKKQGATKPDDVLFQQIIACQDKKEVAQMLHKHLYTNTAEHLEQYANLLQNATNGLINEKLRLLRLSVHSISAEKRKLKNLRRREIICLRRAEPELGIRLGTNFHLVHNSLLQILYGLLRISEPAYEHVDNNFTKIDSSYSTRYIALRNHLISLMKQVSENLKAQKDELNAPLREECRHLRAKMSDFRNELLTKIQQPNVNISTMTLLLHIVQETEQLALELRLLIKNCRLYHELIEAPDSSSL